MSRGQRAQLHEVCTSEVPHRSFTLLVFQTILLRAQSIPAFRKPPGNSGDLNAVLMLPVLQIAFQFTEL